MVEDAVEKGESGREDCGEEPAVAVVVRAPGSGGRVEDDDARSAAADVVVSPAATAPPEARSSCAARSRS